MLFKDITYLNPQMELVHHKDILVQNGRIGEIGENLSCPEEEVVMGADKLLLPALVNSHCHSAMTLLRGYGEGLPLERWLHEKIFPFEDQLCAEAVYAGSMAAMAEMLRSGVGSFSDMYFFADETIRAALETGMNLNMAKPVTCFDDSSFYQTKDYQIMRDLYENYHNMNQGQIKIDMCAHAEYTSTPKVLRGLAEYTATLSEDIRMHIHLSETLKEHEECKARHSGKTPAEYMLEQGIFDFPVTAAHCVYAQPGDMEIFKEKGVSPVYCPSSNLKLGSGFAPVSTMLEQGINVTLGTDGASSNNNLDMLEEMHLAALLEKGRLTDPTRMPPQQVLQMATANGAKAQGRYDSGSIQPGFWADLTVIDMDKVHLQPCFDMLANLLFAASSVDVEMTICRGKVLYNKGEYKSLDIEKVKYQLKKYARETAEKVGK